ncbi:MAG: PqqD family protein [Bryobacteraceae bacterium]
MSEICFRVNAPSVIHEKFDDELVAINLDTGVYHSLAGAAADAFQLLTEEATLTEVAEALANKYAASVDAIHAALTPFFEQLRKEDLICQVDVRKPRGPLQLPDGPSGLPLGVPTLEAYRDLQSLFLLDPVHEVGEEGWPNPALGSPES